jgi:DNA ligase 1
MGKYLIKLERRQNGIPLDWSSTKIIETSITPKIGEGKALLVDPPIYETISEVTELGEYDEILYKKDSKDKIRTKIIATTPKGELIQLSGLVDGKLVEHISLCKPKNVGRSNETTPVEQAVLEAKSKVNKALDKGYFKSIEEAKNEVVIMPMLAKNYGDEKSKVEFPFKAQPKLDGMRCLGHIKKGVVNLISRGGKNLNDNFPHIVMELEALPDDLEIIIDGELYAHGDDFQRNMELSKKYRPGETEAVKFNIYDMVNLSSYELRLNMINQFLKEFNFEHLAPVDTVDINSEEELKAYHLQNVEQGYEGTMVRWGSAGYKTNGKSSNLLKYKDFIDIALPIKDVIANDKDPNQGTPVFHWPGAKDDELKAGTRLTHELRVDLLENKENYIGLTAELRFPEYYNTGVPRCPVMVGIRLDK